MTQTAQPGWTYLDIGEVVEADNLEVTIAILPLPDDEVVAILRLLAEPVSRSGP